MYPRRGSVEAYALFLPIRRRIRKKKKEKKARIQIYGFWHCATFLSRVQLIGVFIFNVRLLSFFSLTRVTKSYLLALGTTQISSFFTKH